jgi:hypothetical protein
MPGNLLSFRNQIETRSSQDGRMQRLTDVARGLWTAGVLMEERAAGGQIKESQAGKDRQRALSIADPRF